MRAGGSPPAARAGSAHGKASKPCGWNKARARAFAADVFENALRRFQDGGDARAGEVGSAAETMGDEATEEEETEGGPGDGGGRLGLTASRVIRAHVASRSKRTHTQWAKAVRVALRPDADADSPRPTTVHRVRRHYDAGAKDWDTLLSAAMRKIDRAAQSAAGGASPPATDGVFPG